MTSKKWIIAAAAVIAICSATSIITLAKDHVINQGLPAAEPVASHAVQQANGEVSLLLRDNAGHDTMNNQDHALQSEIETPEEIIAESDDHTIHMTGIQTNEGTYDHLKLETPAFSRSLPGYNVTNPTYAPQIICEDVNGDGNKESVVILTTGYGTGVYRSDVVVYNSEGDRIPVEDANTAFLKQFDGSFNGQGLTLNVQGQSYQVPYALILTDRTRLNGRPQIGSIMQYAVSGGVLTATTAVQISPAEFVGDLTVTFTFKNGQLQAGSATFELYPEYSS